MDKAEIYGILGKAYFSDDAHEAEVIDHLPRLLRSGSVLADVGASLGQYTRATSRSVRYSKIYAIEADPIRVEELQRNCAA